MNRSSARPTYNPWPLPFNARYISPGSSAEQYPIATLPSNCVTALRKASSEDAPPRRPRSTSAGMTLASVVMGSAKRRLWRTFRSAWLSTSPFRTATETESFPPAISSPFTGCAFGSEMIPTLAQRVWPSTTVRASGTDKTRRNKSSAATCSRMCLVLSPSSPISAAAL